MIWFFNDISFAWPQVLWGLLILPVILWWYIKKYRHFSAEINVSTILPYLEIKPTLRSRLLHFPFVLRLISVALIIIAMARPQSSSSWKDVKTEGIDIVLAMDISASMLAQDFSPNRLEASKDVAIQFIDNRPFDRIGLVIFSGESFTQCPLTTDHSVIKNLFMSIKTGMIMDGTAIGMGLANAVNRIKESNSKSKVVILLTDGVNNSGTIAPMTAAEIAKAFDIRVYTIGVGSKGKALSPVAVYPNGQYQFDYMDVKIDEDVLAQIASLTGGKYFRATNKTKLAEIYHEIDKLEKSIIEERSFTNKADKHLPFVLSAIFLLLIELILKTSVLKSIP